MRGGVCRGAATTGLCIGAGRWRQGLIVGRQGARRGRLSLRRSLASVSRAFRAVPDRAGLIVGIVPCGEAPDVPQDGYPNPFVELPIVTHLPRSGTSGTDPMSRNHINVLSADAVLVLPGGAGTLSEVRLALDYGRPVAAFFEDRGLLAGIPDEVPLVPTLDDVGRFLERLLP